MKHSELTPLRRALIAIALLGALTGIALFVIVATSEVPAAPVLEAFITLLVGWSFIGTGLFAWDRRPTNLIGQLMVGVGFGVFVAELTVSDIPLAAAVGFACNSLAVAFLIHLLVVYPSGRARSRVDRFFIGYAYIAGGLVAGFPILFYNPATDPDCAHCVTSNPLLIHDNLDFVNTWLNVLSAVSIPVLVALFIHLVRRARSAGAMERRSQEAVWWAGGATVFLFAATLLTNLGPESGNYDDVVWYIANLVFATVPFAFLLGLLRTRLSEADLVAEENVRLDAELQARLDDLRESRARIVQAGDAARRKLERDLHDGAQQRLVAVALAIRLARRQIAPGDGELDARLSMAEDGVRAAVVELRDVAHGLFPAVLADEGLRAALEELSEHAPRLVPRGLPTGRFPGGVEAAAYFATLESLRLAEREVTVDAVAENGCLRLVIGAGTKLDEAITQISDRVGAVGGTVAVEGAELRLEIPCES